MILDLEDWRYLSEGNAHIAFEYASNKESKYQNTILLFNKKDRSYDIELLDLFYTGIIELWLSPYVNRPVPVNVDYSNIPKQMLSCSTASNVVLVMNNMMKPKYSSLSFHSNAKQSNFISFEIKLKSGFKSCSPFLKDCNMIKSRISRFQLMQRKKNYSAMNCNIQPRWGKYEKMSSYDPLDFLSCDKLRINRALIELLKSPQNNLQVFFNGEKIINAVNLNFTEALGMNPTDITLSHSWIAALDLILSNETVMKKIGILQCLDLIDVDGLEVIMKRLSHEMNLQEEEIESLISNQLFLPLKEALYDMLLLIYNYHVHGSVPNVSELMTNNESRIEEVDLLYEFLNLGFFCHLNMTPRERVRIREQALEWIMTLTLSQCITLVRWWLISLGAKDMSVIITLKAFDDLSLSEDNVTFEALGDIWKLRKVNGKSNEGLLLRSRSEHDRAVGANELLGYSIGIIDIGPKPVKKVWEKIIDEDSLCVIANHFESIESIDIAL
jgi:hypothetical protein